MSTIKPQNLQLQFTQIEKLLLKTQNELWALKCWWCHALYLLHKLANNHESRSNLFGLISQQCTTYMSVAALEHMTTGSAVSAVSYRATQVDKTHLYKTITEDKQNVISF